MEFSPRSESGLPAGGGQGLGAAEVTVGRMAQDHTASPSGMSDTAAPTLLLHRHLDYGLQSLRCLSGCLLGSLCFLLAGGC